MKYLAEFKAPKQRMTRPFGYVIKDDPNGGYIVHTKFYDQPDSYEHGHYGLTYEQAAELFADKVKKYVGSYHPDCLDKETQSLEETLAQEFYIAELTEKEQRAVTLGYLLTLTHMGYTPNPAWRMCYLAGRPVTSLYDFKEIAA